MDHVQRARMYGLVLIVHSWNRWLVIVFAFAVLAAAAHGRLTHREWTKSDQWLHRAFISVLDLQVLLGLSLYFVLSPIVPRSASEFKAAMHDSALRFFAVEHITMMLLALVVAHVSAVYARKAPSARARQQRTAGSVGLTLLLILGGIPWPWMAAGRPLWHWI